MTGYCHSSFSLLKKVCLVNVAVCIVDGMIVRVAVMWVSKRITLIILVLHCCHYSILTEWSFITSGAAGGNLWNEIN